MTVNPLHITIPQTYQRLVAIEPLVEQMAPWGMTTRGFLCLLRALQVPVVHIGRRRLVDPFVFSLALHEITRLGSPDFLAPGCKHLRKGKPVLPTQTTSLSLSSLQSHLHDSLLEMATRSHIANPEARAMAQEAAAKAAAALARALNQSSLFSSPAPSATISS